MTEACEICGLPVSRSSLDSNLARITRFAEQGQGMWLLTLNAEMVSRGLRDPAYWSLVKQADLITADGMPLVWASRVKYPEAAISGRTTGVDLVNALLRQEQVLRFAVIGGVSPQRTVEQFGPAAVRACAYVFEGKVDLTDEQVDYFCAELTRRQVQVVYLALGVPKQDQLAVKLRQRLPQLVLLGIGGTFEILGPGGRRAPLWMRQMGLEWLFRLYNEPRRLWRRYLINYPPGIWFLIKDSLAAPRR